MGSRQRGTKSSHTWRGVLSGRHLGTAAAAFILLSVAAPSAYAQMVAAAASGRDAGSVWSFGEAFTFLFVTLGPLNVIGPFAAITEGRDAGFKRRLALRASLIAAIALLVAATVGATTLKAWGISVGALLLAAGAILFLVALRSVLAGYDPREPGEQTTETAANAPSETALAFSPLAFPTIVTPYGLALLILLFTLYPLGSGGSWILGAAALVVALDLLAMLCADLLAKIPFGKAGLDVLGAVMGVLLVAMGVQAVADGLRLLAQHQL